MEYGPLARICRMADQRGRFWGGRSGRRARGPTICWPVFATAVAKTGQRRQQQSVRRLVVDLGRGRVGLNRLDPVQS